MDSDELNGILFGGIDETDNVDNSPTANTSHREYAFNVMGVLAVAGIVGGIIVLLGMMAHPLYGVVFAFLVWIGLSYVVASTVLKNASRLAEARIEEKYDLRRTK